MKYGWMVLCAFLLSACSSVPKNVRGDVAEVTVSAVQTGVGQFQGMPVRWGGVIAQMQIKDGMSKVEIVEKPLSSSGRPVAGNLTGGRFIAIFSGFVDPLIFATGREITVMGSIQEVIEGKISEQPYTYPVLAVSGHHLWEERQYYDDYNTTVVVRAGYWDPYYNPYWWGHPYHYHGPVYVRPRPRPGYQSTVPSAGSQVPVTAPPVTTPPVTKPRNPELNNEDPVPLNRPPKYENWQRPVQQPKPSPAVKPSATSKIERVNEKQVNEKQVER